MADKIIHRFNIFLEIKDLPLCGKVVSLQPISVFQNGQLFGDGNGKSFPER